MLSIYKYLEVTYVLLFYSNQTKLVINDGKKWTVYRMIPNAQLDAHRKHYKMKQKVSCSHCLALCAH